jgi:hypothetical protein
MLKTLRQRLIFSHILPLLVIMPIVGIALIYVLETGVLLPNLVRELTGQAELVGELVGDRPDIWHNQPEAEAFARKMSDHVSARVMLLDSEGRLLASSDPTDHERLNEVVNLTPPPDVLAGRTSTQTTYSHRLQSEIAEVWLPTLGAEREVIGIIRLSQRLFTIEEQFTRLRYFIVGVLMAGLVLGSLVGLVLALGLEQGPPMDNPGYGIDLEFLLRRKPVWRTILKNILFKDGDLIELAEKAEEEGLDH